MKIKKGTAVITYFSDDRTVYDYSYKKREYGGINLHHSKLDRTWTDPGRLSSTITNDGNNYVFESYNRYGNVEKTIKLDFSQAEELRLLLKLMDDEDTNARSWRKSES